MYKVGDKVVVVDADGCIESFVGDVLTVKEIFKAATDDHSLILRFEEVEYGLFDCRVKPYKQDKPDSDFNTDNLKQGMRCVDRGGRKWIVLQANDGEFLLYDVPSITRSHFNTFYNDADSEYEIIEVYAPPHFRSDLINFSAPVELIWEKPTKKAEEDMTTSELLEVIKELRGDIAYLQAPF